MIKNFQKYNEGLFSSKKKKEEIKTTTDWRDQLKENCYMDNLKNFYQRNCQGNEEYLLKYFNILVTDKDITCDNEKFRGRTAFLKKFWIAEENSSSLEVWVLDDKGVEHVLPIDKRIDFALPTRKISKADPYGEENWEE